MPTTFLKELQRLKPQVWEVIQKYLPAKDPHRHYQMIADYPRRQGKYLRPALVILAAQMYGGKDADSLLTAAALQTAEDWLLIHDDVEDHSLLRRSKPALSILYSPELALNAGDGLHIIMWKILGDNVRLLGPERGWKVYDKMIDVLSTTIEGQFIDLSWTDKQQLLISEKDYFDMIGRKSAYYSITAPLQLGAIIAGQPDQELAKIETWSKPAGLAFQLWDDVLDILTAKNSSKELYRDISEGKRTLLLIHLLKQCTPAERRLINKIYSEPREQKSWQEKKLIVSLMKKYGSVTYVQETAKKLAGTAQQNFLKTTTNLLDTTAKKAIFTSLQFIVSREH